MKRDRQTDTQTDIATTRQNRPLGLRADSLKTCFAIVRERKLGKIELILDNIFCLSSWNIKQKIPRTGDKASLDRYGSRVDQEYPKTNFFFLTEKIIKNAKTQKRLEICQY